MTTWDEIKRKSNVAKHGIDLALAQDFDFITADIAEDVSQAFGERRERAVGLIGDRLYVYVYTLRGNEDHAISLRRATPKERRRYEEG